VSADATAQPRAVPPPLDEGSWHELVVPGGRATLDALGVPADQPRALILTELVRRLHYLNLDASTLEAAIRELRRRAGARGAPAATAPAIRLPLPLSPQTWSRVVFRRETPETQLFFAIVSEPSARLLYHGLMSLDAESRRWFASRPQLLSQIHRDTDAVRAFSLFASAVRVREGALVVPGGALGVRRWAAVLDTDITRADRFVNRLFTRDNGRLAGLFFAMATAEPSRRAYLLGPAAGDDEVFVAFASRFVACYASELDAYPFGVRFNDPAMLLLEVAVGPDGAPAGPLWRRFWSRALEGDRLPDDPARELTDLREGGAIDPGWLAVAACEAPVGLRPMIFETLLFAHRVFGGAGESDLADVLLAVRARRLYPAAMTALEQAGITSPATYARIARRADAIAKVEDARQTITALQQFQGGMAITLAAVRARTLSVAEGSRILETLAAVPFEDGRYDGRLAQWFITEWLAALGGAAIPDDAGAVEMRVVDALAGPAGNRDPIAWEGLDYVLDLAADTRRQLRDARRRQRGPTLDAVRTLARVVAELRTAGLTVDRIAEIRTWLTGVRPQAREFQPAAELLDDVPNVTQKIEDALQDLSRIDEPRRISRAGGVADDLVPIVDLLFGHAMAAWAYAPHLADASAQNLVSAGDPSRRHEFGVRLSDRVRAARRWEIAWRGETGGGVSGALLGLDAALARRVLRRLQSDTVPSEPALNGNDVVAMLLTAALSHPRQLTDGQRDAIAGAIADGRALVARAGRDAAALETAAGAAASSAWRTQALGWTTLEEPERVAAWFSSAELAWIGGLKPETVDAWGTAFLPLGCLCLRMPAVRPPDALMGRTVSAVLAHLGSGLMFRIAPVLAQHRLPASLATAVQRYAMRELIDRVRPAHGADLAAFIRALEQIDRPLIEDYIGAVAATGPLVPVAQNEE
jgi:hypothetical protein